MINVTIDVLGGAEKTVEVEAGNSINFACNEHDVDLTNKSARINGRGVELSYILNEDATVTIAPHLKNG